MSTISLHPLLVRAVAETLHAVFTENRYADKALEFTLRNNPKAGSRDRAFIAETTYNMVRYFRLYTAAAGRDPGTLADYWKLIGVHFILQGHDLPAWREWEGLDAARIRAKAAQLSEQRRLRESIPDWLDLLGNEQLAADWDETLHWLNRPADVVLRTNTLKTDRNSLLKLLTAEGIQLEPVGDGQALRLLKRHNVFGTQAFKNGLFEVQDFSSQLVAPLLAPEPGMRVVDACAGAGGKTLHLAALMQSKGSIIALDTIEWKLDELRKRSRRAGVSNIEARLIESRKTIKRLYDTADRLLLDVPCSGLGVLRRNPDTKWKLQPQQLTELKTLQQDILQDYSPIVKPGGKMVYATCSVLPGENQEQVNAFLSSPAGHAFHLISENRILPQHQGFDGFYMALLEKS